MEIKIDIKNCSECPFFKEERMYTADSFEMPFNWFCNKANGRKIAGYVEWHDKVKIPDWCPCRIKVDNTESVYKKMLKSNVVYLNDKIIKSRHGKEEMTPTTTNIRDAVVESWDAKDKILRLITKV